MSWRTPNASRPRRRRAGWRQRMECGGLPPLWSLGWGGTAEARLWGAGADRAGTRPSCNGRDAFHRVPWPGWNRALDRANVLGRGTHPVVCGRPEWGSRAPGAVSLPESASKRAHSKRFASSKAPCEDAAAHGVRRLAAAVGPAPHHKPAHQHEWPSVWSRSSAAPCCAPNWPGGVLEWDKRVQERWTGKGWTAPVLARNGRPKPVETSLCRASR